jgi:hypothetical protein
MAFDDNPKLNFVLTGPLKTVRKKPIFRPVEESRERRIMAKSHLKLVAPTTVNRTVTPRRPPNAELRRREYLTESEVERLMKAAGKNRWGHRDARAPAVANASAATHLVAHCQLSASSIPAAQ